MGMVPYGPNWSVPPCDVTDCRYCAGGGGTCERCGGPSTHQPEWADQPDGWQVEVCRTCGYAISPNGCGGFVESAFRSAPPDPSNPSRISGERKWPDNLAMRILKGEDIVEDHPPQFCAVAECRDRGISWLRTECPESALDDIRRQGISVTGGDQGRWDARVPMCGHHGYQRWFPVISAEGNLEWTVYGPPT